MFEEIYSKLLEHKQSASITWEEVARESGVSISLLTKLSCGERTSVSLSTFEKLSKYLEKQSKEAA